MWRNPRKEGDQEFTTKITKLLLKLKLLISFYANVLEESLKQTSQQSTMFLLQSRITF